MSDRRVSGCGCVLIGFAVILGLFGCLIATFFFSRYRAASDVEARLAEIRASGEPASGAELNAYIQKRPTNGEATRAWLEVLQAIADREIPKQAVHLPVLGDDPSPIPPAGTEWPALEVTKTFLDEHRDLIDQLHDAASRRGGVRIPIDFSVGVVNLSLDHINQIRTAGRLLVLDAHVHAHDNDIDGALRSAHAMFAVGDILRNEPTIISHLVRIAIDTVAVKTIVAVLPLADDVPDERLAEIQNTLRNRRLPASFKQALIGERATTADAFKNLGASESPDGTSVGTFTRYGDLLYYLETTDQLLEALEQPWPKAYQAGLRIDKRIAQEMANASMLRKSTRIMTYMTIPSITTTFHATGRGIAIDSIADTHLAIRRYVNTKSELPRSLDALVPEFLPAVPDDPFDAKPLRYFTKDNAIVLYSIGKDRTDDGGVSEGESFEPDIAITSQRSENAPSAEGQ